MVDAIAAQADAFFQTLHGSKGFELAIDAKGRLAKRVGQAPHLLSGGELRRLQLAGFFSFGALALEHQAVSLNVRVLDEACLSMDGGGTAAFLAAARQALPSVGVLVVSHQNHAAAFAFDRLLSISHQEGRSVLDSS